MGAVNFGGSPSPTSAESLKSLLDTRSDYFRSTFLDSVNNTRLIKPNSLRTLSNTLKTVSAIPLLKTNPYGWVGSALALGAGLGLEYMLGDARTLGAVSTSNTSAAPKTPKNLGTQLIDNQSTTISEFKDSLSAPVSSSENSLLGIIETGSIKTVDAINIQTQILSEQYGLINEHLGAGLLYQDIVTQKLDNVVLALSSIGDSLAILASAMVDSVVTAPEPDFDLKGEFFQLSQTIANSSAKPELSEISDKMTKLEEYATVEKERAIYKQTPQTFQDLEGNNIKTASPDEIKSLSDANALKFHSDTNNQEFEDSDFPSFDTLPILPFVGREDVFNISVTSPTSNPFTHKNI